MAGAFEVLRRVPFACFPDRHPSGLSGRDARRAEFLHADQYQAALKSATGKRRLAERNGESAEATTDASDVVSSPQVCAKLHSS